MADIKRFWTPWQDPFEGEDFRYAVPDPVVRETEPDLGKSNGATILYVEDHDDNRILVRRVLEAEGYRVLEADSAGAGLRMAQDERPDLILVDICMPEVDGLSLASELKEDPSFLDIPMIALTANVMRGDRERSMASGCDGYIQKPIDIDFFPMQIARFLHPTIESV
jgi:two-component system cell cycle response regulator DivK